MLVSSVIDMALSKRGFTPVGEAASSAWIALALKELNAMLQLWAAEGLQVHALTTITKTLTIGDPSYTIGASGDIATRRPVEIMLAKVTVDDTDYPVTPYNTIFRYQAYANKISKGRPLELFYDAAFESALATVWLYPSPDKAYMLTAYALTSLAPFVSAGETIPLPPEYELPLGLNLAVALIPALGVDPLLLRQAREAKDVLVTNNSKRLIREAGFDSALLGTSLSTGMGSILTG